jgi:hypothetical protein
MTRHRRAVIGLVLVSVGFAAIGAADGANPPTPDTGQAVTSIQLPRITVTDAGGTTHTVDLGALTAQALTDTGLLASLGVNGGAVLGGALPGWTIDTTGGPQSADHDIALTTGSAAADVDLIGYDVNAAGATAHSSLDSLTGTAATSPLAVHVDLGQHGVDATVQPDTSSSTVNLTVTGLQIGMGDLLSSDVLDALPLSGLVDLVSGLGLTLPAGATGVQSELDALTAELATLQDATAQLGAAQTTLATLLASIPSTTTAQQQLTDAQTQLANDLAALQLAQSQLGVDTTAAQDLAAQLATATDDVAAAQQQLDDANAAVTNWTNQVNTLSAQLATLVGDPLKALQAAQVSAQLQDAQDQLAAAQADVTAAQTALTAAQGTATQLQQQVDQANTTVTADQQNVATLQQLVPADQAAVDTAQSALDALVATVLAGNQQVIDDQTAVSTLTTALTTLVGTFDTDLGALPDLAALRSQLVDALTAAPLLDLGTLGATLSSTAADDAGTGSVTCTVTGASVLGQPIPVGPCSGLVSHFADIVNAVAGALAQLPLAQAVTPVLDGLAQSTTLTTPAAGDADTTGAAGLTPLHLVLPSATLAALTDPAVSALAAALGPTQTALGALGLPAVTSALTGSLGPLGTSLAAMPTGGGLAGLHTAGVDVSLVGLSTSALHHRSLPAAPAGSGGGPAGQGAVSGGSGGSGSGGTGGTGGGGTTSGPADPPSANPPPHLHLRPPTPVTTDPPARSVERSPLPALPFTGDNAGVELAAAMIITLGGGHLIVAGRRPRRTGG